MASVELEEGRDRWRVASDPIPAINIPSIMIKKTFAKWKTADGDMTGFINTAVAQDPNVGFFASFAGGAEDPVAIWAIDLADIDQLFFN